MTTPPLLTPAEAAALLHVSAWEPTPDEIALIAAGAPIYLWVWGTGHPPVMLTVGEVT